MLATLFLGGWLCGFFCDNEINVEDQLRKKTNKKGAAFNDFSFSLSKKLN
jgi:hypothetical protein